MFVILKLIWKLRKLIIFGLAVLPLMQRLAPRIEEILDDKPVKDHKSTESPKDLSKKGWKQALTETKTALKDKDLSTSAASLAYYATLTFFPAVLGAATIFVLITSPDNLLTIIDDLRLVLPTAIADLLYQQLSPIAESSTTQAGAAAAISVVALLWTLSGGLQNLVKAVNKAYESEETRNFLKLRLTSVGLSILLLIVGAFILFLLILQGDAPEQWGLPDMLATLFPVLRWPLLIVMVSVLLAAIYRYAPNRPEPKWQWVSWGATAATIIWLMASALFFLYAQNFADFNKTYGTFASIIVLMTWFYISSLIVLLGAQVNKKLEEATDSHTTN